MIRQLSSLRSLTVPVVFALVVAAGASAYWLFYVQNRAAYLTARNLRVLETLGGYVERSLDSHTKTVDGFVKLDKVRRQSKDSRTQIPLLNYLELAPAQGPHTLSFVDAPTQSTWVTASKQAPADPKLPRYQARLETILGPIFEERLPENLFAAVLLANSAGKVLYQHGRQELAVRDLKSLLADGAVRTANAKEPISEFAPLAGSTNVLTATIAGRAHQVFVQPCCGVVQTSKGGSADWVLVGLIPSIESSSRSLALSFTLLAALGLLTLGTMLAWPLLKLVLVGTRDRVRSFDVVAACACAFIGVTVLVTLLADTVAARGLSLGLDHQLETFAEDLRGQFFEELAAADAQLNTLREHACKWDGVSGQLERWATNKQQAEQPPADGGREPGDIGPFVNVLRKAPNRYPAFDVFALVGNDGHQVAKWSTSGSVTPLIRVSERPYFRFFQNTRSKDDAFLQSLTSQTTAKKQAVLSKGRSCESVASFKDLQPVVATLTLPMLSVVRPVLPSGFGFVVIDDAGGVIFHSDQRRNAEENLFVEVESSARLRAAVGSRRETKLDLRYWGAGYRALVTPLYDGDANPENNLPAPWTLVTFYEQAAIRDLHLEWLLTSAGLLLVYVLPYLVIAAGFLAVQPGALPTSFWPDRRCVNSYRWLAWSASGWCLALFIALVWLPPPQRLVAAVLVPWIAWTTVYWVLSRSTAARIWKRLAAGVLLLVLLVAMWRGLFVDGVTLFVAVLVTGGLWVAFVRGQRQPGGRREPIRWASVRRPYCRLAVLMLVVSAVLPAFCISTLAQELQFRAFVRSQQLVLAARHAERDAETGAFVAMAMAYSADTESAKKAARDTETAKAAARDWGNYSRAFFGSTVESLVSNDRRAREAQAPVTSSARAPSLSAWLDELLPYATGKSAHLRRLLADGPTDDGTRDWYWDRGRLVLNMPTETSAVRVSTIVPNLWIARLDLLQTALLVAMVLIAALLAILTVRFFAGRLFLVGLRQSDWSPTESKQPIWKIDSMKAEQELPLPHRGLSWDEQFRNARRAPMLAVLRQELASVYLEKDVWRSLKPAQGWLSALDDPAFDFERVLTEATEKARPIYQALWSECTDAQKVVLHRLATGSVASRTNERTIGELIEMGLVRRVPHLVVMTETFKRFIDSEQPRREVALAEQQVESSVWARVRGPLSLGLALVVIFFVVTQQEAVSQGWRMVMTLAAALPAVIQLISMAGKMLAPATDVSKVANG